MRRSDKIRRAIAFYFSCALFCVLLPIVLSYSLGYKIDYRSLTAYKTGILYIQSRPAGASIRLNGKALADLTPAQIEELKPGNYRVEVDREGFYPWKREVAVRPNMATKVESIVLFPMTQELKKLGERGVTDFAISGKGALYYMKKSGLYRSNMDGTSMKRLSSYAAWPDRIIGKKFAPDGERFLYFTDRAIWVVYPEHGVSAEKNAEEARIEEAITSQDPIIDAFWYPGAGYIIVVTDRDIKAAELHGGGAHNVVTLYNFTARPQGLYYDGENNAIYFTDMGLGKDQKEERYLYKVDLKQKFFEQLMKGLVKKGPEANHE